jgi:hypothetical protein
MHTHIEHRTIINYQTVYTHLPPGQWTIRPIRNYVSLEILTFLGFET